MCQKIQRRTKEVATQEVERGNVTQVQSVSVLDTATELEGSLLVCFECCISC